MVGLRVPERLLPLESKPLCLRMTWLASKLRSAPLGADCRRGNNNFRFIHTVHGCGCSTGEGPCVGTTERRVLLQDKIGNGTTGVCKHCDDFFFDQERKNSWSYW